MPFDLTTMKQHARAAPAWLRRTYGEARSRFAKFSPKANVWSGGAIVLLVLIGALTLLNLNKPAAQVVTAPVTRQDLERTVLATGVLEPTRLVSVGAQVSGQVRRLHVVLGQVVKQGDIIAEIDSTTQNNNVDTARAALLQIRAQRAAAAATLIQAQSTFTRQSQLLEADAISRADYETAQAALEGARNEVAALDAQIQQANLELSTARVNQGYTRILAPMDGTIVAVVTEEGQTVNANQSAPTIVKLAQLDTMAVSAEISEADVVNVTAGQKVYFTTLGNPNERHYAELRAIAPAPDSIETDDDTTSTDSAVYYNGLFDVDNGDGKLRTGMTAQVYIVLDSAANALTVPSAAIKNQRGENAEVQVQTDEGTIETRHVRVGINNNIAAQILDGLREGEQVVIAAVSGGDQTDSGASRSSANPMMMGGGRGPRGGGPP